MMKRALLIIGRAANAVIGGAAIVMISFYRAAISPVLMASFGPACRFEPSCSAYACEAIREHGIIAGGWMALRRIGRCRPAGGWGDDPVPRARPAGA